jgi:hypothetical protein
VLATALVAILVFADELIPREARRARARTTRRGVSLRALRRTVRDRRAGRRARRRHAYLEVGALRFGARLRWQLECEPGVGALRVPPLYRSHWSRTRSAMARAGVASRFRRGDGSCSPSKIGEPHSQIAQVFRSPTSARG